MPRRSHAAFRCAAPSLWMKPNAGFRLCEDGQCPGDGIAPLFCFFQKKRKVANEMKQKISLASSTSILIGAVIAILALLRGPVQTVLLLVTFALWGLWVLLTLLRPSWRANRDYRRREEREAREQSALSGKNLSGLLLTHVNYRVSDYLSRTDHH